LEEGSQGAAATAATEAAAKASLLRIDITNVIGEQHEVWVVRFQCEFGSCCVRYL
jgi:hypothetical protein